MTYIFVVVMVSNWVHGLHVYYLMYSRLICNYRCQYCSVSKVHVIRIRPLYLLQCTSHPFICSSSQYGQTALMMAKVSEYSNPSTIKLLEEATESHVSPYQYVLSFTSILLFG